MANKRDYYEVLGISKSATDEEIKKAYRTLAKKYHPDVSSEPNAAEKFKEVQEAYDVLKDPQKRAQYDRFGFQDPNQGFGGGGFNGFSGFSTGSGESIFDDIFNMFGFGGSRSSQRSSGQSRGRDVQSSVTIDFLEACFGCTKEVKINKYDTCPKCAGLGAESKSDVDVCPKCRGAGRVTVVQDSLFGRVQTQSVCPTCQGRGKVIKKKCSNCNGEGRVKTSQTIKINIPSGIDNGQGFKLNGKGDAGVNGGPNGDLLIIVNVRPHEIFVRDGLDIYVEMPITFSQAALGDTIKVPSISGEETVKIPAGTQSGTRLTIKGKGITMTRGNAQRSGNFYVNLKVVTPTKLTSEQKELFVKLSNTNEKGDSFFEKIRKFFKKNEN